MANPCLAQSSPDVGFRASRLSQEQGVSCQGDARAAAARESLGRLQSSMQGISVGCNIALAVTPRPRWHPVGVGQDGKSWMAGRRAAGWPGTLGALWGPRTTSLSSVCVEVAGASVLWGRRGRRISETNLLLHCADDAFARRQVLYVPAGRSSCAISKQRRTPREGLVGGWTNPCPPSPRWERSKGWTE
jgi:hypothetical protein